MSLSEFLVSTYRHTEVSYSDDPHPTYVEVPNFGSSEYKKLIPQNTVIRHSFTTDHVYICRSKDESKINPRKHMQEMQRKTNILSSFYQQLIL